MAAEEYIKLAKFRMRGYAMMGEVKRLMNYS